MTRTRAGIVAVIALIATMAVGAAPKKVIYHYHWSGAIFDEINMNAAKRFMARNPDVEVKMVFLPDNERVDIIRTFLAAGTSIDSFGLANGESAEFLEAGQAVSIIPAAFGKKSVEDVVKMWTPGAIETCGGYWDGKYYGIPFEISNYVGWINVADMKEVGLNRVGDKPKTWDQFVQVAGKLKKIQGGSVVRNGFMCNPKEGIYNFLVLLAMMEQLGLDWGSEKGLLASMDRPEQLALGLRTYTDFVTASKIWDPALSDNDRVGFAANKSAIFLTAGTWYWGLLERLSMDPKDAEPFPYPRFADGRNIGGVGYGYCLYVSKRAKDPGLSFRFVDELASQPNEFITHGYNQPRLTLSNGSPALDPARARKYIPYYDQVFKGELARHAVWLSSTKGNQVADAVWKAISSVIYERVSVDDSVAALQGNIQGLFPRK